MSASSSFTLQTPDGTGIHVHRWLPDGEVRALVKWILSQK
jgi:hypothetical protein